MKKYSVIRRLLISFGCVVFLFTSCDDSAKGPAKPTVVRKKLAAQEHLSGAVASQQPAPVPSARTAPEPARPEAKTLKTAEPPASKTSSAQPAAVQPAAKAPQKPMLAQAKPQNPSGESALPQPKSDISKVTPQPVAAPAAAEESRDTNDPQTLLASADSGRPLYDPKGKIDPFEPLFRDKPSPEKVNKPARKRRVPRTPLEKIDLSQLKLVAIIIASSGNRALVEESSGKGYVIKDGTYIGTNAGKVTAIKKDMVVVEEEYEDVFGKLKVQKKELKLPKPPGEL